MSANECSRQVASDVTRIAAVEIVINLMKPILLFDFVHEAKLMY